MGTSDHYRFTALTFLPFFGKLYKEENRLSTVERYYEIKTISRRNWTRDGTMPSLLFCAKLSILDQFFLAPERL